MQERWKYAETHVGFLLYQVCFCYNINYVFMFLIIYCFYIEMRLCNQRYSNHVFNKIKMDKYNKELNKRKWNKIK